MCKLRLHVGMLFRRSARNICHSFTYIIPVSGHLFVCSYRLTCQNRDVKVNIFDMAGQSYFYEVIHVYIQMPKVTYNF